MKVPPQRCPRCGQPVPQSAPGRLCPVCLLRLGLAGGGGDDAIGAVEAPTSDDAEIADLPVSASESPVRRIGRYALVEVLGEGGFGVVWKARQLEPVRRTVALKIVKPGLDTRQVLARFEAERQALAMMDHPNITRVFDGGASDSGQPFFVMELTPGLPITEYSDSRRLGVDARLELFLSVCDAVQHAHQKGVIHRDLKPSNILVADVDGRAVPKVIDFGVAKALQGPLTDKNPVTRFDQCLGTPAYMSPEQAGWGGLDVDTRTDIYALGVLLYELLTGSLPSDAGRSVGDDLEDTRRHIREVDPPRPSTRLKGLGQPELEARARRRNEAPRGLVARLEAELDWIILKALERDRARRYASAHEFASDIRRHLANEPIVARPPTRRDRLCKYVRRHRVRVFSVTAVSVALVLGTLVSGWMALRATRAERETRRRAYAAEVNLAQQHLTENNLERALELLEHQAPLPGEDDLRGFEWYYLRHLGRETDAQVFRDQGAEAIAYSRNGKWLAYGDTRLVVREAATLGLVTNLEGRPRTLAFSPDDALLAVGGESDVVLWRTEGWRQPMRLPGARSPALFSPDGAVLLTGQTGTNQMLLWDTTRWVSRPACPSSPDLLYHARQGVAFSPAGNLVATPWLDTGGQHFGVRLWTLPDLSLHEDLFLRESPIFSAAFAADGRSLILGTYDGRVLVWDLENRRFAGSWRAHAAHVTTIATSPTGDFIATSSSDRTVRLWDSSTHQQLALLRGHLREIGPVAVSPDGHAVVSGAHDGTTRLWRTQRQESSENERPGGFIAGAASDQRLFVFGPDAGDYRWRFAADQVPPVTVPDTPPISTTTYARSTDVQGPAPLGVIGRTDGSLELWNLGVGSRIDAWRAGSNELCVVTLSPNGHRLATGSVDGEIKVWTVADRREVARWRPTSERVTALAFSPDGTGVASCSSGSAVVEFRDLASSRTRLRLRHDDLVIWIAFGPDHRSLATGGLVSGEARLWDLPSGRLKAVLRGHLMGVARVEFSPDGRTLATGSFDGRIKLWSPATLRETLTLTLPEGAIFRSLGFSRDGESLAVSYLVAVGITNPPVHRATIFRAPKVP